MAVEGAKVEGGFGETPKITFEKDIAPKTLEIEVLVQGDGAEVQKGQTLECNYHGVIWDSTASKVFDSSFERGESIGFPIGVGAVIQGWDQTLVGQKIGSRVIVSIPPEFGYGERGIPQAGIGGFDTLVFVVDILGVS